MNEHLWYRKNPVKKATMNSKLRQEIMDVLPFDIDVNKADLILETIFKTIIEGAIRDGHTSIKGFGRFVKRYHPAIRINPWMICGNKRERVKGSGFRKPKHFITFVMNYKTRRKILDGPNTNDQRT